MPGTGGNHGVRNENRPSYSALTGNAIVFAIFLAVCSPPQQALPFLKDSVEQVLADGISILVVVL
jgi:hypothetical protein